MTGVGAPLVFLTPDLMPLEEVFAKVKAVLKVNDGAYISTQSPEQLIKLAFSTVTKDDCLGYINSLCYLITLHACTLTFSLRLGGLVAPVD